MAEINLPCSRCKKTRASGIFEVTRQVFIPCKRNLDNGKVEWFARFSHTEVSHQLLCAADAFNRKGVRLIQSLTTDYVPAPDKPVVQPLVVPLVRHISEPMKPLRLQYITSKDYDPNPEWLRNG